MCGSFTWGAFPARPACKANWGWTGNSTSGKNIESSTKPCKHLTSSLGSFDSPMLRPRPSVSESVLTFAETDLTLLLDGGGGNIMHWAAYLQQYHEKNYLCWMISNSRWIRAPWNSTDLSSSFSCSFRKSLYLLYTVNSFLDILSRPMQVYTRYVMKLKSPRPTWNISNFDFHSVSPSEASIHVR